MENEYIHLKFIVLYARLEIKVFAYGSCLFLGGRIQDTSNSKTKFDFDGKVYTYGRLVWCDRECFNAFVTLNNR